MKSWQTWLNILLVLAIALLILFWPSNPDPAEITTLKQRDQVKQEQIDSVHSLNQALLTQFQKEILRREQDSASFVARLKAKQARQVIIRPVVMAQVDSLPIVKQFILRSDSIQADLTARVTSLEFELISTTKTLKSITENYENELHFTQDRYKIALEEAEVYRKGWKKEQKKVKLFKVLTVAGTVLGLVGGSQL